MTELVFILDRSGSMAGLEADTIGGFNAMIEKQKREPGPALVSTVLFSNESEVIHDRLPLDRVPPMTEREYFPRGCTALLPSVLVRARGFERVRGAVSREEDPAFAVLGHLRHDDRSVLRKALPLRTHGFHSRARRLRRAVRGIRVLAGRRCYERSFLLRTGLSVC